jgi:hypothetical protein
VACRLCFPIRLSANGQPDLALRIGRLTVTRELTEMILGHDTPLRLDDAAKIAFPDGGMTAGGLRIALEKKTARRSASGDARRARGRQSSAVTEAAANRASCR